MLTEIGNVNISTFSIDVQHETPHLPLPTATTSFGKHWNKTSWKMNKNGTWIYLPVDEANKSLLLFPRRCTCIKCCLIYEIRLHCTIDLNHCSPLYVWIISVLCSNLCWYWCNQKRDALSQSIRVTALSLTYLILCCISISTKAQRFHFIGNKIIEKKSVFESLILKEIFTYLFCLVLFSFVFYLQFPINHAH